MNRKNKTAGDTALCILLSFGAFAGLNYLAYRLAIGIVTGSSAGRLGAMYHFLEFTYFVHMAVLVVGIALSMAVLWLTCKWIFGKDQT